jgi:hypothetical protein
MMKAIRCVAIAVLLAAGCGGEIVDRIAANIGLDAITDSEVREHIRLTALIEDVEPDYSTENLRTVLDRLIDQTLLRNEIEFVRFDGPEPETVDPLLEQVKERFPNAAAFEAALQKYRTSEERLASHLRWQLTMLQFIEFRFQPAVEVTNALMRQEYRQQAQRWKEEHGTEAPPLDQIRGEIEKIVRQRLIDSALDRWLGEVRTQNTILYHGSYK